MNHLHNNNYRPLLAINPRFKIPLSNENSNYLVYEMKSRSVYPFMVYNNSRNLNIHETLLLKGQHHLLR